MEVYKLPELIKLTDFGGDICSYLEAVYNIFKRDFVYSKPTYRGKKLKLKKYPLIENKEYTFYHFTHKGNLETNREPDLRRMERIAWPRPMIDNSEHKYLMVWRVIRRGEGGTRNRILIFHESEKYLVVLEDRRDYILPWTAYLVSNNKRQRLIKEYNVYKNTETAK